MEIWKDIDNFKGMYEISNLGNVRSLARSVINKKGRLQYYPTKLLKFDVNKTKNGTTYHRITLSKNHTTTRIFVHRLVAETFISNPEKKPYINHIDNNGSNNSVSNLEWCTHSENMLHAQKQGRLFASQSKGGKQGSKTNLNKMLKTAKKLIGTKVYYWEILEYVGKQGSSKHQLKCKCTFCGTVVNRAVSTVLHHTTKGCIHCKGQRSKLGKDIV